MNKYVCMYVQIRQRKFLPRKYPYVSSTWNVAGVEIQNKNPIFLFMCSKNSYLSILDYGNKNVILPM